MTSGSIRPQVIRELAALGRTLLEPIAAGRRWVADHMPDLLAARDAYGGRATGTG
jgi:DNA-binding HxlR family transcriptional regulator